MARARLTIPRAGTATLEIGGREVRLTNLEKPFWPEDGITKGDLIQYYADVAALLLPHVRDRAMVMKRYPHGAGGDFFFMKRAPVPRPAWLRTCSIDHESGNVIDFPVVEDVASLLWVINLGCIDLNQWYATCDDVDRPDYLHFDLDPGEGAAWDQRARMRTHRPRRTRDIGDAVGGQDEGIERAARLRADQAGPVQKEVWTFAKALAVELAARHPALMTAEYKVAKRPRGRVLVDYNQKPGDARSRPCYPVRPRPRAAVSTPVTLGRSRPPASTHRRLQAGQRPRAVCDDRRSLEAAAAKRQTGRSQDISRIVLRHQLSFSFQLRQPLHCG